MCKQNAEHQRAYCAQPTFACRGLPPETAGAAGIARAAGYAAAVAAAGVAAARVPPLARQAVRASTHIMARANVLRRVPGLAHLKQIAV